MSNQSTRDAEAVMRSMADVRVVITRKLNELEKALTYLKSLEAELAVMERVNG
jgi:hypothetical protein